MRKVVLYGFVLISVTAVSFLVVTPVERKLVSPDGASALSTPTRPTQVEVTNFPAVQAIAGTVDVGNLPLDANGNVRIAGILSVLSARIHFVGFTTAIFPEGTEILPLSRACASEFPGSRVCEQQESIKSIPPPPTSPAGGSMVIYQRVPSNLSKDLVQDPLRAGCLGTDGDLFGCGTGTIFPGPFPAACCGF